MRRAAIAWLCWGWAISVAFAEMDGDFGADVRKFSSLRHQLAIDLAKQLDLSLPEKAHEFFKAAEAGDWSSVSNRFQDLKLPGPYSIIPELRNELWSPVLETLGGYEQWVEWKKDSALLKMFYQPVLTSMPKGSVYFGGTDPGRFVITTANAIKQAPDVYCLTQNALADGTYTAYLRAVFGKDLWIPSEQDMQRAFQQYVGEVQAGKRGKSSGIEIVEGRVTVTGVMGVMQINGILARMIVEHNQDAHPFFIEESYVIEWMYPHLEPHGLILKLNKTPLKELPEETTRRDMEFWKTFVAKLHQQPGFGTNPAAQKTFAKLRCASAGVYAFRKRYKEAETAFQQALTLCPISPEANYRLAKMYADQDEYEQARSVITKYITVAPADAVETAKESLRQLDKARPLLAGEIKEVKELISQLGAKEFSTRREARKKLAAFGPRVLPQLHQQQNTKDPEVRGTIWELIEQLERETGIEP